jgi:alpha-tubulin suppressor-like RCC1 family protein
MSTADALTTELSDIFSDKEKLDLVYKKVIGGKPHTNHDTTMGGEPTATTTGRDRIRQPDLQIYRQSIGSAAPTDLTLTTEGGSLTQIDTGSGLSVTSTISSQIKRYFRMNMTGTGVKQSRVGGIAKYYSWKVLDTGVNVLEDSIPTDFKQDPDTGGKPYGMIVEKKTRTAEDTYTFSILSATLFNAGLWLVDCENGILTFFNQEGSLIQFDDDLSVDGYSIPVITFYRYIGTKGLTPDAAVFDTLELTSGTSVNEISIDGTLAGNSDDAVPTEKAVKTYVDGKISIDGTLADDSDLVVPTEKAVKTYVDGKISTDGTMSGDSDSVIPTEQAVKTYVDSSTLLSGAGSELTDGTFTNMTRFRYPTVATCYDASAYIRADGTLMVTGDGTNGALGSGVSVTSLTSFTPVLSLDTCLSVNGGDGYFFVLLHDKTVRGFGKNTYGQLGDTTTTTRFSGVNPELTDVTQISCGYGHTLFLKSDGTLYGCGYGGYGALGQNDTANHSTPVSIDLPSGVTNKIVQVSAASDGILALVDNGDVYVCGRNNKGQLGLGSITPSEQLTLVKNTNLSGIVYVASGSWSSFAIKSNGYCYAWGYNGAMVQLGGVGSGEYFATPTQIPSSANFTYISPSGAQTGTAFLNSSYELLTCGWDSLYYGIGQGAPQTSAVGTPTAIVPLSTAINQVDLHNTMIAMTETGEIYTCGKNDVGQRGDGTTGDPTGTMALISCAAGLTRANITPTLPSLYSDKVTLFSTDGTFEGNSDVVLPTEKAVKIYVDGKLSTDGTLADNSDLVVPTEKATKTYVTTSIDESKLSDLVAYTTKFRYTSVSMTDFSTLYIRSDGTLMATGDNSYNAVGQSPSGGIYINFTPISELTSCISVDCGEYHIFVLLQDKTVRGFGYNKYGQLGNGITYGPAFPPCDPGLTDVIQVRCGYLHTLFLKNDGTMYGCGWNSYGMIGQGDTSNKLTPTIMNLPEGITNAIVQIAGSRTGSLALLDNGDVYFCGKLHDFDVDSPVMTTLTKTPLENIIHIVSGLNRDIFALKTDGFYYKWGESGATGFDDLPVKILTTESFVYCSGRVYLDSSYYLNASGTILNESGDSSYDTSLVAPLGVTFNQIAASSTTVIAISETGDVYTSGRGYKGKRGDGTVADTPITDFTYALAVVAGNVGLTQQNMPPVLPVLPIEVSSFSTDGTFTKNTDLVLPTEKAVKIYVDGKISDSSLGTSTSIAPSQNAVSTYITTNVLSTDATFVGDSDTVAPTEKATAAYIETAMAGDTKNFYTSIRDVDFTIKNESEKLTVSHYYETDETVTEYSKTSGSNGQGAKTNTNIGLIALVQGANRPLGGISFNRIKFYCLRGASGLVTITCYLKQGGEAIQFGDPYEITLTSETGYFYPTFTHSSIATFRNLGSGSNIYDYIYMKYTASSSSTFYFSLGFNMTGTAGANLYYETSTRGYTSLYYETLTRRYTPKFIVSTYTVTEHNYTNTDFEKDGDMVVHHSLKPGLTGSHVGLGKVFASSSIDVTADTTYTLTVGTSEQVQFINILSATSPFVPFVYTINLNESIAFEGAIFYLHLTLGADTDISVDITNKIITTSLRTFSGSPLATKHHCAYIYDGTDWVELNYNQIT